MRLGTLLPLQEQELFRTMAIDHIQIGIDRYRRAVPTMDRNIVALYRIVPKVGPREDAFFASGGMARYRATSHLSNWFQTKATGRLY